MKVLSKEEFKVEYNKLIDKHVYTERVFEAKFFMVTYPGEETIAMRVSDIEK